GNLTVGDILKVSMLLSESHVDSSQLMGVNVYAVAGVPSDYNEMDNNISDIANLTRDFSFASVYGAETYTAEIGLSSNVTGGLFVAVGGDLLDDDNVYNLLLSSSNTSGSGLQSYVCYEGGSCVNVSAAGNFGVRVEKREVGLDGVWRRGFTVSDGIFYFIVRGLDVAGNWGNVSSRTVRVDSSGPSTPNMLNPVAQVNTTTVSFNWTAASDIDSGVDGYYLQVSAVSTFSSTVYSAFVGNFTNASVTVPGPAAYYARVKARNLAGVYGSYSSIISKTVDTTAPVTTIVTPQGTTVHSDVVISVETNEQAQCRYSVASAPYSSFSFTNSTYHETILGFPEGSNSLSVKCADLLNNENIASTDFDVDTLAAAASITFPYVSGFTDTIARFNITVASGSTPLSGYRKDEFSFKLGNSDYPYSISDRGNGIYTIAINTPLESGSYALELFRGSISSESAISVSNMLFMVSYSEAGIAPSDLGMIAYYVADNYSFGLASDEDSAVISAASSELNASSDIRSGSLFIFVSRPAAEVAKAEYLLESERFSDALEPSFGYGTGQHAQTIYAILRYNNIILIGNETLKTGIYNLVIENDGIDAATNKKRILIWAR
ncbi:MAG: fibronectin type III domain-containing protein, partial [Candidatus Woesearchaeota archaeon]